MSKEKDVEAIDLTWLSEGKEDPHPRYVNLDRSNLMGAHILSDDALAFKLSMLSTISADQDMLNMVESHRNGEDYISKNATCEIAKDRIRWLSRRVAVLEGRYPGVASPLITLKQEQEPKPLDSPSIMAQANLELHVPLLLEALKLTPEVSPANYINLFIQNKIYVNAGKLKIIVGHVLKEEYSKRWHLYVEMVTTLFKHHGIYVAFEEDTSVVMGNELVITKSKYYASGRKFAIGKSYRFNQQGQK